MVARHVEFTPPQPRYIPDPWHHKFPSLIYHGRVCLSESPPSGGALLYYGRYTVEVVTGRESLSPTKGNGVAKPSMDIRPRRPFL